jgi:hypothetical protein
MTGRLRGSPKRDEGRDQQPEQSFHEEEKKTPEAEALNPLSYGHALILAEPLLFGSAAAEWCVNRLLPAHRVAVAQRTSS